LVSCIVGGRIIGRQIFPRLPESPRIKICTVLRKKYFEVRDIETKQKILRALKKRGCTATLVDILETEKNTDLIKYITSLLEE